MRSLVWKLLCLYSDFTEISSQGPINNPPELVQVRALAPNRRQAIIWNNDGLIYCLVYAPLSLDEAILFDFNHSMGEQSHAQ